MVGVTERQSDKGEQYFLPKRIVFPDKKPAPAAGGLLTDCQKSGIASAFEKEDRYERNPSGVSFVFNHRIFRTFIKVLKMLVSLSKRIFDKLNAPGASAPGALLHQSIEPVISLSERPMSRRACISSVQLVRGEEML